MRIKLFKFRMLLIAGAIGILSDCNQISQPIEPVKITPKKEELPYKIPVAKYLADAKNQEGDEKQRLLLLAADSMISEGQWRQAFAILAQTSLSTVAQNDKKKLLLGQINGLRGKPQQAIENLSQIVNTASLSVANQIQFHELLATSYRLVGNSVQSIGQRIQLESLLSDPQQQADNRKMLWMTLLNLPLEDLKNQLIPNLNEAGFTTELQGWQQLALIARQPDKDAHALLMDLKHWQAQFSTHPARLLLPNPLSDAAEKLLHSPQTIALLLPLTGPFAGPGNAVKEGFMAANALRKPPLVSRILSYDTNKEDIGAVYQQAVDDGADYVVGPLNKTQVATIATLNHPVPTLLLNDASSEIQTNSYVFGLSPVEEATLVALKGGSKGYRDALIISPDNAWGQEITKTFTEQWQKQGGTVVDILAYGANDDLNTKISHFLQVSHSEDREKQLKLLLGQGLEAVPNRRQDFDMIFLLAYPSTARQIMPLLRYYYAGDVPVYATSSVYSGSANALKDKDLDGLVFCDMPWVFSHQMGSRNWPEQFNSYNRLYAIGMDSYALVTRLNQLILFSVTRSMDDDGTLYLKSSQQIARTLEWGQFKQGLAHSIERVV